MSDLIIREATREDLPAIVALLADDAKGAAREDASEPLARGYVDGFKAIHADPNHELIVVELAGRIVGTMQLSYLPGISHRGAWRGQIEAVRVASQLRGQGIGARLIGWAVDRCRARGCRMVQLTSHRDRADAHRFYERLGFVQSHAGFKLKL